MKTIATILILAAIALAGCTTQPNPYAYGSPQWFAYEQQRREAQENLRRSFEAYNRSVGNYAKPPAPVYPPYPGYPAGN